MQRKCSESRHRDSRSQCRSGKEKEKKKPFIPVQVHFVEESAEQATKSCEPSERWQ